MTVKPSARWWSVIGIAVSGPGQFFGRGDLAVFDLPAAQGFGGH